MLDPRQPCKHFPHRKKFYVAKSCLLLSSQSKLFFPRFWIEGIILSVVGCIGIMGNLISLHILRKDSMRKTSFDEMLTHLLILDTIMVIFFLLDSMTTNVFEQTPDWYIILYPYVIHPGKAIFVSATVFMVVAVSADRQRAICHSMLYRVSQKTNLTHMYLLPCIIV